MVEVSIHDVERRIITAFKTLRALPDREAGWLRFKSNYPDYLREWSDFVGVQHVSIEPQPRPLSKDIDDMHVALGWLVNVPMSIEKRKKDERILILMSLGYSLRQVADRMKVRSPETIRSRKNYLIKCCWGVANGIATKR